MLGIDSANAGFVVDLERCRVERGGDVRSFHVEGTAARDVLPIVRRNVARESRIMTDEAGQYAKLGKEFAGHEVVRHGKEEYVVGDAHTNTLEGY